MLRINEDLIGKLSDIIGDLLHAQTEYYVRYEIFTKLRHPLYVLQERFLGHVITDELWQ